MKLILFCSERHVIPQIIQFTLEQNIEIIGCVLEGERNNTVAKMCEDNKITMYSQAQLCELIATNKMPEYDFGISYLYNRKIKKAVIDSAKQGIINFHPAPVQEHKGIATCCYSLLNNYKEWAVTSHFVTEEFDEGDIIMERYFSLDGIETAIQMERYTQKESVELFKDIIKLIVSGKEIPRKKQELDKGTYFGKKDLEEVKKVSITDSAQQIDKKIRSLWFPPYHGAYIEIDGKKIFAC